MMQNAGVSSALTKLHIAHQPCRTCGSPATVMKWPEGQVFPRKFANNPEYAAANAPAYFCDAHKHTAAPAAAPHVPATNRIQSKKINFHTR